MISAGGQAVGRTAASGHRRERPGTSLFTPAPGMMKLECALAVRFAVSFNMPSTPRTAPHRLSRMRLHHARAQPAPAGASARRSSAATPAATAAKAEAYCRRVSAAPAATRDYARRSTIPRVDAVVIAVPPRFHLDLTLQALAAGKHVLVEKPAFLRMEDYQTVRRRRATAPERVVLVGENDHYKPLAVTLRRLLADGVDRRDGVRALHDHRASG